MEPATISAAAAVVGTIIGGASAAANSGSSGFIVEDGNGIHYPKEIKVEHFVGAQQQVWKNVVSFESDLWWGDDLSCQVQMSGYCSEVNDELVCYPDSDDPKVPANRFMLVNFVTSGDSLDHSLLTCAIEALGVEGDANDPRLSLLVSGRFDPYGSGDTNYSFQMLVDMYGTVTLGDTNPGETKITQEGDHICVYYN